MELGKTLAEKYKYNHAVLLQSPLAEHRQDGALARMNRSEALETLSPNMSSLLRHKPHTGCNSGPATVPNSPTSAAWGSPRLINVQFLTSCS